MGIHTASAPTVPSIEQTSLLFRDGTSRLPHTQILFCISWFLKMDASCSGRRDRDLPAFCTYWAIRSKIVACFGALTLVTGGGHSRRSDATIGLSVENLHGGRLESHNCKVIAALIYGLVGSLLRAVEVKETERYGVME